MPQSTLSFESDLEIRNLYAAYAFTFDRGEGDEWAQMFTSDGKIVIGDVEIAGRTALAAFVGKRYEQFPGTRHHTSNVELEVAAGGVRGRAYVLVLRVDAETLRLHSIGEYEDELVRSEGLWRFARRSYASCLPASLGQAELKLTSL